MSKLPAVITLTVVATLLAGCSSAPANEPDARPAATSETASPSASPSATPMEEETVTPEPEPEPEEAEESTEASTEPSPEPSVEPTVEAPEEQLPSVEPLPAGPNDPFVPPPHGEPNPLAPVTPGVPGVPHSDPSYFENPTVYPVPAGTYAPTQIVQQGATLTVAGDGYAPGQEIYVMLGWPNTDYNYITQPTAHAGPGGSFAFPITIGTNVPPRDYVVMTVPMVPDPDVRETLKRYSNVTIIAR